MMIEPSVLVTSSKSVTQDIPHFDEGVERHIDVWQLVLRESLEVGVAVENIGNRPVPSVRHVISATGWR